MARPHPVDGSRGGRRRPVDLRKYKAGHQAGRADKDAPARLPGGSGKPPKRNSCPIKLLLALPLIPYAIARALIGDR